MGEPASRQYKVLLVDDSADDRLFMRIMLERNPRFPVAGEVRDGQEAIDYLTGSGLFSDRQRFPFPDILLLDLKMPRKTGFDVLEWLRTAHMPKLTVMVVSGSWLPEDVTRSLALGAHAYFKKTSTKAEQDKMIADIEKLLEARA
ncbi:MAG: response regulator [Methylacidiphilales bacterium]|nr:response regulator [Candidatus Methylacidiphilales bacterium]